MPVRPCVDAAAGRALSPEVPTVRDAFSETACGLHGCSAPPIERDGGVIRVRTASGNCGAARATPPERRAARIDSEERVTVNRITVVTSQ